MKYVYRLGKIVPKEAAQYVGGNRGPYVIRDEMPPTEQVDGQFYTSKAAFRAKGRELGLMEIGNEKFKPKQRATADRLVKEKRIQAIKKALALCHR